MNTSAETTVDDVLAKFERIPVAEITATPSGLVEAYQNYWWIITPNEEVLKFKTSMQCNQSREICERFKPACCTVRQIPLAFVKVNIYDYV